MSAVEGAPPSPVTRRGYAAYALALGVVLLDQLLKWVMVGPLALVERGQIPLLPPVLNLTFVANRGVSFGFLTGGDMARWGLSAFSVVVAAALAWWARRAEHRITALGLGLIMGGAIGNAVDRVRLGYVIDFIDVSGLRFPWVFNVADSAITIGVALLLLEGVVAPKKPA